jgi:hypothetical protein
MRRRGYPANILSGVRFDHASLGRRAGNVAVGALGMTIPCAETTVGLARRSARQAAMAGIPSASPHRMRFSGSVSSADERATICYRAQDEQRAATRFRRDDRGTSERAGVVQPSGGARISRGRGRGRPIAASRLGQVAVAGPLAPHVLRRRLRLSSVWRPHARGGHHRGPRRHPEDSHPSRAPDRRSGAAAAAPRPVRLELSPCAGDRHFPR